MVSGAWTPEQDAYLKEHYLTADYKVIAEVLGKSISAVRNRRWRTLPLQVPRWTESEIALLRAEYEGKSFSEEIDLDGLATVLGKHKTNISRKARELGLTNVKRRTKAIRLSDCRIHGEQLSEAISVRNRAWMSRNQHPRGMQGKKHTLETLEVVGKASRRWWAGMSEDERADLTTKMLKRRVEVHGRIAPSMIRGSWKAGWREIGSVRKFYRSRWEANYARYLQWLKDNKQISDWQHEPETFWFEQIKRGVRSYLPDFKVHEANGSVTYHEVKGWMDDRSKTIIKRMRKYHPNINLIVIDAKQYNALSKRISRLVPGWE